jgi:hypothetical protein
MFKVYALDNPHNKLWLNRYIVINMLLALWWKQAEEGLVLLIRIYHLCHYTYNLVLTHQDGLLQL